MAKKISTITVHIVGWCVLLLVPCLSIYQTFQSVSPDLKGVSFLPILIISIGNIFIFYTNYYYLIPKYFFAKKYFLYGLTFALGLLISFLFSLLVFQFMGLNPEKIEAANPILKLIRPVAQANAILMLAVSFITSFALSYSNRLKLTEQEKLSAQIASLKSQINPHFLFNTLNNIYATVIDSSPKGADMIDKLSEMMRYTMKETQQDFVRLESEINHINNFIELQKVRIDRSVKLEYQTLENIPDLQIAPMLLIPIIENAFKHGINSEQKSNIKIVIQMNKTELQLIVLNNKVKVQKEISERSGLGIENTRYRLNLIYPSNHLLVINDTEKKFSVSLHINLQ